MTDFQNLKILYGYDIYGVWSGQEGHVTRGIQTSSRVFESDNYTKTSIDYSHYTAFLSIHLIGQPIFIAAKESRIVNGIRVLCGSSVI